MKFAAVVLLIAGLLCNSALAGAEGPIPFASLEQAANAQSGATVSRDATANSMPVTAQPAKTNRPLTTGGRVITGVGIGFAVFGVGLLGLGINASTKSNNFDRGIGEAVGFGVGGVSTAVGTGLIIAGLHWRSSK